jgi:cellulose 1,4-beta-cellobiosidase
MLRIVFVLGLCIPVLSQQAGEVKENYNLPLPIARCTMVNGCVEEPTTVTMDANWRWLHEKSGYDSCFVDGSWSATACSGSGADCASNCAVEGISKSDWAETYGISRRAGGVRVNFKTGGNVGSRFYLLDASQTYKQFSLLNREIAFDVDVSTLPCGMNGAVYFSEMPADGDKSSSNTAGAAYGTGYCDAQCPADVKFISGEANSEGWGASGTGPTTGKYGSCCAEMDLWEANKKATAFTAHPCAVDQLYRCEGAECKTICDMPGCDFNSYRMGARDFYGPGAHYALNTLKPFTIVTQFITVDGSDHGDLSEIRRFYIQDGKKIENSKATLKGLGNQSSLSDKSCAVDKEVFGEENTLSKFGGMKQMGEAIGRGMTLVLSLWDDGASRMHWLDSNDPAGESPEKPGVARGPCPEGAGDPSYVRSHHANAFVDYFNFKYGELGSTSLRQASPPGQAPASPQAPSSPPAPVPPVGSTGRCCYGGCSGHCKDSSSWCSQSRDNCEGSCSGEWCVAAMLSQVRQHRQLRGKDHMFIQKLRRFSVSKASLLKFKRDSAEL